MKDHKTTSLPPGADAGLVDLDKVRADLEQDARDGEAVKRRIDALKAEIDRRQKPSFGSGRNRGDAAV
jgi:cell division septum initiation protein DivIVA